MVLSNKKYNKGKKAEFGGLCFDEGYMQVFIAYHKCTDGHQSKVLLDIDEVRLLANKFGLDRSNKRKKLIKWLAIRYNV